MLFQFAVTQQITDVTELNSMRMIGSNKRTPFDTGSLGDHISIVSDVSVVDLFLSNDSVELRPNLTDCVN